MLIRAVVGLRRPADGEAAVRTTDEVLAGAAGPEKPFYWDPAAAAAAAEAAALAAAKKAKKDSGMKR